MKFVPDRFQRLFGYFITWLFLLSLVRAAPGLSPIESNQLTNASQLSRGVAINFEWLGYHIDLDGIFQCINAARAIARSRPMQDRVMRTVPPGGEVFPKQIFDNVKIEVLMTPKRYPLTATWYDVVRTLDMVELEFDEEEREEAVWSKAEYNNKDFLNVFLVPRVIPNAAASNSTVETN